MWAAGACLDACRKKLTPEPGVSGEQEEDPVGRLPGSSGRVLLFSAQEETAGPVNRRQSLSTAELLGLAPCDSCFTRRVSECLRTPVSLSPKETKRPDFHMPPVGDGGSHRDRRRSQSLGGRVAPAATPSAPDRHPLQRQGWARSAFFRDRQRK